MFPQVKKTKHARCGSELEIITATPLSPPLGGPAGRYSEPSSQVPFRLPRFHLFPVQRRRKQSENKNYSTWAYNGEILWFAKNDTKQGLHK